MFGVGGVELAVSTKVVDRDRDSVLNSTFKHDKQCLILLCFVFTNR